MFITHKRMLQWMTAAHTVQVFGRRLKVRAAWQAMIIAPLFAVLLSPRYWVCALELSSCICHFCSVGWLHLILQRASASQTCISRLVLRRSTNSACWHVPPGFTLSTSSARMIAGFRLIIFRRTARLVAHHTSPTNIGLMLLSTLSAHDMGYIGLLEFSLRLHNSFDSMDKLERVRGHFLNWYEHALLLLSTALHLHSR